MEAKVVMTHKHLEISILAIAISALALTVAGYAIVRSTISSSSIPAPMANSPVVDGVVKSVQANSLTITAQVPSDHATMKQVLRTFAINAETKITVRKQKDMTTFQKELEAYTAANKNASTSTAPAMPPMPFTESVASTAAIVPGIMVSVALLDPSAKNPVAKDISVFPAADVPPMPASIR